MFRLYLSFLQKSPVPFTLSLDGRGRGCLSCLRGVPRGMRIPRFRMDGVWTPASACPRMFLPGARVRCFLTFYEFINREQGSFIGVDKSFRNVGYPNEAVASS